MTVKTPIRTVFDGDGNATGLAELQSGEFIGLTHGGLGASLSIGTTGQVLKVSSGGALEFGDVENVVNIDGATDLTGSTLVAGDQILLSDGGTEGRVTLSQLDTLFSGTTQTLTNKTIALGSNTISGSLAEFNSALSDGSFASLAGTETLTNKTLTSPVIDTITNVGTLTLPTSTDTLVGRATTDTLTNKTLTSPTINAATFTEDVNFDSGTLFIDASTDRVGIGSTTLSQPFTVHNTSSAQIHLRGGGPAIRFSSDVAGNSDATRGFIGFATNTDGFMSGSAIGDLVLRGKSQGSIIFGDSSGRYAKFADGGNLFLEGSLTFEGSSPNNYETTLEVTDPTADRTITLPDATGTVVLKDTTDTLTNKTLTSPTITGTGAIAGTFTGNITGDVTGNADTATILQTARNIAGQSFDGSANITIAATDLSDTDQSLSTTDNVTFNNMTVSGNLTVSGTTTTVNTETINLADNTITLNSNATGSATENGGIEIERGDDTNKTLLWNETSDKWTVGSETFVAGTFEGNLTGNVTGNADTATTLETARNIAGQSFDGSANITIASTDLSNTSDVVLLTSTQTLTNKTITSPIVSGLTLSDSSIVFEGSTADANETTLTATDPTADRTITLPNASGGVAVFATAPGSAITDGSDGQALTTDGSGNLSFTTIAANFPQSTLTIAPGSEGNFDLSYDPTQSTQETPFETVGTDAFGITLSSVVFSAMDPSGETDTVDLGAVA
jgi:hypothetical protein